MAIGGSGNGGPRGLLRIGYPILPDGRVSLINFIAVEPTVAGHKAYSELEQGADGAPGKRFTVTGTRRFRRHGNEIQFVSVEVERFHNGAHVRIEISFDSARPDEVELRTYSLPGSAKMDDCVLTATMGNYERLRRVTLSERTMECGSVFNDFLSNGFTDDLYIPLDQLAHNSNGDVLVSATPDEADPRILQERLPQGYSWRYPGVPVTQYWRAPRDSYSGKLKLRLNGRRTYWMSHTAIPGGVAFENFELRDRFQEGQPFVFGVTRRKPDALLAPQSRNHERFRLWVEGWK